MTDVQNAPDARSLARPGGVVAYEVTGAGRLILCVPGMGDPLRAAMTTGRTGLA